MFFLLKLPFLPIWLPLKIIGELIEHSGRGHRRPRHYATVATGPVAAAASQ